MRTEEELIRQLKAGDESAYKLLFDQYYSLLVSHSMKYQGDMEVARELVQQLFVSVYERRAMLEIRFSLKAYLLKSMYYLSLQQSKNKKVQRELGEQDRVMDEDLLVMAENEARIWDAIHELTPQQQTVLKLSRMDQLSNDDIARHLNLSKRTVETHISNALKNLRERLLAVSLFFSF